MNGAFGAMIGKELLEQLRSFKLVWVPLVFIILGIMQPVMTHYLPVILESAGGMPEGTVIEIPTPTGGQVLAETLSQFGLMGTLILVLVFMGVVSAERNSGAASLILVKPITAEAYLISKWISMMILSWGSLLVGYGASWYYTWLLFEAVDLGLVISSYLLYGLWFAFIMSITLLFSTLLRSVAGSAFSALGLAVLLSLLSTLLSKYMFWSPGALSGYAYEAIGGSFASGARLGSSIGFTLLAIAASLFCAIILLRRTPAID